MTAVNLGGDTDTIAAIAGSLAGMCYPVPENWVNQLVCKDYIAMLCDNFAQTISNH